MKRTHVRWATPAAAISVALMLVASACGNDSRREAASNTPTTSAAAKPAASAGGITPDTSGCPAYGNEGVTDTEIVFGASAPLSGPAAGTTNTWMGTDAYFAYVNSKGGVPMKDGKTRKLVLKMLDDQLQPSRTKANVDQLVNQDKVFALLGMFGSSGVAAIAGDVNKACVPSVFYQAGPASLTGPKNPWTLPGIPPYEVEAKVLVSYLKTIKPDATIAALYQNDDLGKSAFRGMQDAIKGTNMKLVASESYESTDPDVFAQMTTLANTKADAFFDASFSAKCVQSLNAAQDRGWKPIKLVMITCGSTDLMASANPGASDGLIQAAYKKDVNADKDDPAVKLYLEWFAKNHSGQSPFAGLTGWAYGEWIEQALKNLDTISRPALVATVGKATFKSDMFYNGVVLQTDTTKGDYFPIEGFQIVTLDQATKSQKLLQPPKVIDLNGQTPL